MEQQNINRSIGVLEAKVERLEDSVKDISEDIKSIANTINLAKGGWKVALLVVAGLAGILEIGIRFFEAVFIHKG